MSKVGKGISAEEAAKVAKEVSLKVANKAEVTMEELSNIVVSSLRKVNKAVADEFVKFRDKKLKAKKKKTQSHQPLFYSIVGSSGRCM
jgi:2-phosphoglycerate kinase